MLSLILSVITLFLSGGVGLLFYVGFQTRSGCLIAAFVVPVLLAPFFLVHVGLSMVQQSQLTFHQYYDGVELSVERVPITCERDGACAYTHTQQESYPCTSGGTPTTCTTDYSCPYATEEDRWVVHSTIGDITVGQAFPVGYQLYSDTICDINRVPQDVLQEAGVGEPQAALAAQQALARGDPRPATLVTEYQDPIKDYLDNSSDPSLEQVTSDDVGKYLKLGVLPQINGDTYGYDQANKAYLMKLPGVDAAAWNEAVAHLDIESGTLPVLTTRFDIQLVAVNSALVPATEAENYKLALQSYWEGKQFGQAALPKNMCVVVVGTDGSRVQWATGFTLINDGQNNELWTALALNLPGAAFDPATLVGFPKAQVRNGKFLGVTPAHSVLEQLVITGEFHFERPHETTHHGGAGFDWLLNTVSPTFWQCVLIVFVSTLLVCLAEAVCYLVTRRLVGGSSAPSRGRYGY